VCGRAGWGGWTNGWMDGRVGPEHPLRPWQSEEKWNRFIVDDSSPTQPKTHTLTTHKYQWEEERFKRVSFFCLLGTWCKRISLNFLFFKLERCSSRLWNEYSWISLFLIWSDISFLPGNKTKMKWKKLIWILVSTFFCLCCPFFVSIQREGRNRKMQFELLFSLSCFQKKANFFFQSDLWKYFIWQLHVFILIQQVVQR